MFLNEDDFRAAQEGPNFDGFELIWADSEGLELILADFGCFGLISMSSLYTKL